MSYHATIADHYAGGGEYLGDSDFESLTPCPRPWQLWGDESDQQIVVSDGELKP